MLPEALGAQSSAKHTPSDSYRPGEQHKESTPRCIVPSIYSPKMSIPRVEKTIPNVTLARVAPAHLVSVQAFDMLRNLLRSSFVQHKDTARWGLTTRTSSKTGFSPSSTHRTFWPGELADNETLRERRIRASQMVRMCKCVSAMEDRRAKSRFE